VNEQSGTLGHTGEWLHWEWSHWDWLHLRVTTLGLGTCSARPGTGRPGVLSVKQGAPGGRTLAWDRGGAADWQRVGNEKAQWPVAVAVGVLWKKRRRRMWSLWRLPWRSRGLVPYCTVQWSTVLLLKWDVIVTLHTSKSGTSRVRRIARPPVCGHYLVYYMMYVL